MAQIIGANQGSSVAFVIPKGQQVTLSGTGLAADDRVVVEIVELSKAPDFSHDPCCNLAQHNIQVIAATPLKCPDGSLVQLTAEYPWVVLDAPQMVTLRAKVESADPGATIEVNLDHTESDGCISCACRGGCVDDEWQETGETRCVGGNLEAKETSNCGNFRWTDKGPVIWVPTGEFRCRNGKLEEQEVNDCGATRWEELGDVTWNPTGETRCRNDVVEEQEADDCGNLRWVPTTTPCNFCASYPIPRDMCGNGAGYAFREGDNVDPAATVELTDCDGGNKLFIYPTAGPGHSAPVTDCAGVELGFAANSSECADREAQAVELLGELRISKLPTLKIDSIPDIKIKELPKLELPALEISKWPQLEVPRTLVEAIRVGDEVWTYWSDGQKEVEKLPVEPCPSVALPLSQCAGQAGFAFHPDAPKPAGATVALQDCEGVTQALIFATPGAGHSIPVTDCDGALLGFAANSSDCAGQLAVHTEILGPVDVRIAHLPKLRADILSMPELKVAPLELSKLPRQVVAAVEKDGVLYTVWSDGVTDERVLPVAPTQPEPVVYCASFRLFCDGTPGFAFHEADVRDPAATVKIESCDGSTDPVYVYAAAGPGHTVRLTDCDGAFIGYGVNQSACAPDYTPEIGVNCNPVIKVAAPEVNVAPAEVNFVFQQQAAGLVAANFDEEGALTLTSSDGSTVTAQIPTCT